MKIWDAFWTTDIRDDGWVLIENFVIPEKIKERKEVWRTFRKLEQEIASFGLKGWLMWTKITNYPIIKAIDRLGGTEYAVEGQRVYFKKKLMEVQTCAT